MQFVANIVFLSNKAKFVLKVELRLKNLFGSFVEFNENFNAMKLLMKKQKAQKYSNAARPLL